eukprot:scaffold402_cov311-Prasinococcus_capsulatus_cf.AAC.1
MGMRAQAQELPLVHHPKEVAQRVGALALLGLSLCQVVLACQWNNGAVHPDVRRRACAATDWLRMDVRVAWGNARGGRLWGGRGRGRRGVGAVPHRRRVARHGTLRAAPPLDAAAT